MAPAGSAEPSTGLYCIPEQLPFEARSVGLVVLPHVLEFSDYPHQILREVERVLVPEGHLVVLGFNPVSVWGLVSLFRRRGTPWNGRFSSLARVKDWLALLNFELTGGAMIYHKPPVQSERIRQRLEFLEKAGERWWPLAAAVYAVSAQKRRLGVTPLNPGWRSRSRLRPGLARPVAKAPSRLLKNSLPARDTDVPPRGAVHGSTVCGAEDAIKHCKCLIRRSQARTRAEPGALKKVRKDLFQHPTRAAYGRTDAG